MPKIDDRVTGLEDMMKDLISFHIQLEREMKEFKDEMKEFKLQIISFLTLISKINYDTYL